MANNRITYLKVAFGYPDEKNTSQLKLWKLREINHTFSDYFADFERIADYIRYNTKTKYMGLLAELSTKIQ